ncbi:MAG: aldehyde dehydrogenase family protein [Aigarchaeota archaeon]|nr:aldehyde dehydrogenase family protein [Candidatus Pelearchaeum maunauluense]
MVEARAVQTYLNYVNGEWVRSSSEEKLESINPATGELVAVAQQSTAEDVDAAVDAARDAFFSGVWSEKKPQERARVLFKIAELLRSNADTLATLLTRENGKPIKNARGEILYAANVFEYYGALARVVLGNIPRYGSSDVSLVVKEPVGVCGLIVPWNSPIQLASWKLAPALAAGCTIVLKPSEYTPAISLEVVKLISTIEELPRGVLNVVTGPGDPTGTALVKNTKVDKISFTGSTETGRRIMEMAAVNLKKINLECGGKSANIVFDDANLEQALRGTLWGIFRSAGQSCNAGSRLLVQETIYEEFVRKFVELAKGIKVGNGLDPSTEMGPIISERQLNRVLSYIKSGVDEGARLLYGGKRLTEGELARGFFIQPTIFDNVSRDMRIFQEEIFGPVVCVIPFKNERDAIEIANDTKYGLAGNIWSRNLFRIMRVARGVRTGTIWVNRHLNPGPEPPFGGYKQSGIGREQGIEGLMEYLETKHICLEISEAFGGPER